MPDDRKPVDPVSENMDVLMMKPVKAFLYQDHQSHIKVHMAAMQDPKIMQMVQMNPMAQQIQAAAMAHITEHLAMEYRKQMEARMGIALPTEDEDQEREIPQEMEVQISQMAAQAAAQMLQQNQQQQQAQQNAQTAQDPLVQMQQMELQLKQQEVSIKEKKMQADAAARADQIEIEKMRIQAQKEIAGMQIGAKAKTDKANLMVKQHIEGVKVGAEIASKKAQMQVDHMNNMAQNARDRAQQKKEQEPKGE
jgi:hypothetical protein